MAHNWAVSVGIFTLKFGGKVAWVGLKTIGTAILTGFTAYFASKHMENKGREPDPDIDDFLEGANEEPDTRGPSKIYSKPGGKEQKDREFDKTKFDKVQVSSDGRVTVGYLPNDRKIVNRDISDDGRPTIEIQTPGQRDVIKIRHDKYR